MPKLVREQVLFDHTHQSDFFDDFHVLDVTNTWVDTSADAGAAPALQVTGDTAVTLTTGAVDNNECLLATKMTWDIVASRPLLWEARAKCPEAATNAANYFLGMCSVGQTADVLVDNGAGMVASFSGFGFYKVDGSTSWKWTSSVAATRYPTTDQTCSITTGSGYYSFRVEVRPISSTQAEIAPMIDSNGGNNYSQLRDSTTGALIKSILTYTSYAPAYSTFDVKAGSATGEVMTIDWNRVSQRR